MLKVVNPYNRETTSEDSVAFKASCVCRTGIMQSEVYRIGPGCNCSCVSQLNLHYNFSSARSG